METCHKWNSILSILKSFCTEISSRGIGFRHSKAWWYWRTITKKRRVKATGIFIFILWNSKPKGQKEHHLTLITCSSSFKLMDLTSSYHESWLSIRYRSENPHSEQSATGNNSRYGYRSLKEISEVVVRATPTNLVQTYQKSLQKWMS